MMGADRRGSIWVCAAAAAAALAWAAPAWATTYYVDAARPDDSGSGLTAETAKRYIASGIALMVGGDTLVIRDGTYANAADVLADIPSGSANGYTIIRADHDGGAVIRTEFYSEDPSLSYVQFEGLKFESPTDKGVDGNHIKILRCAFAGGPATGNSINFGTGGSYVLVEDCWFYGAGGRYKILVYQADHVVLRRVVVRDDGGWTDNEDNPEAGICVYESSDVSCQNCLVLDSKLDTYDDSNVGAFYLTGHDGNPPSDGVAYLGSMAIGNVLGGWHVDTDDQGVGLTFQDVVTFDVDYGIATSNTSMDMVIERASIGHSAEMSFGNWGQHSITATDSVIWAAGQVHSGDVSVSYSDTYDPEDFDGTNLSHLEPTTAGLLYLPRIEAGSQLASGGQNGGQQGARILGRIGTSGTLWGEPGYDTPTGECLWPWPNEERIKADMVGVSERGFCGGTSLDGSPQTLTHYIWEYLGSAAPSPYCEGGGATGGAGGGTSTGGTSSGGSSSGGAGAAPTPGAGSGDAEDSGGCGCRLARASEWPAQPWLVALGGLAWASARRRRRS
jgi:hypothetical protein